MVFQICNFKNATTWTTYATGSRALAPAAAAVPIFDGAEPPALDLLRAFVEGPTAPPWRGGASEARLTDRPWFSCKAYGFKRLMEYKMNIGFKYVLFQIFHRVTTTPWRGPSVSTRPRHMYAAAVFTLAPRVCFSSIIVCQ